MSAKRKTSRARRPQRGAWPVLLLLAGVALFVAQVVVWVLYAPAPARSIPSEAGPVVQGNAGGGENPGQAKKQPASSNDPSPRMVVSSSGADGPMAVLGLSVMAILAGLAGVAEDSARIERYESKRR